MRVAVTVLAAALMLTIGPAAAPAQEMPDAGSQAEFEGVAYQVLAAGTAPMEIEASGESLVIVIEMQAAVAVIVPEPGETIRLDPAQPMLWVDGEPHDAFVQNRSYMERNAAGKPFAILEYDAAAN